MDCYICTVSDPKETQFTPNKYDVCNVCRAKLSELVRNNIIFDASQNKNVTAIDQEMDNSDSQKEARIPIKQIICDRRASRGSEYETWVLDGINEKGKTVRFIGKIIILYESNDWYTIQGFIFNRYQLLYSKTELEKFLEKNLSKFGIGYSSSGTVEFMNGDDFIDLTFTAPE